MEVQAAQQFPEIRRAILTLIKQVGSQSIAELSASLNVSYEAIRQQMVQLEKDGWIAVRLARRSDGKGGRPQKRYSLTSAGDHLFAKDYDQLAIELVSATAETLGPQALQEVLAALTEKRVRQWQHRLEPLNLEQRLEALSGIYLDDDPFMKVEKNGEQLLLVERNCPFLNVAHRFPMLCSVTICTLSRLLGVRVVREQKFQNGDGCCVFRVIPTQPVENTFRFAFEEDIDS